MARLACQGTDPGTAKVPPTIRKEGLGQADADKISAGWNALDKDATLDIDNPLLALDEEGTPQLHFKSPPVDVGLYVGNIVPGL